MEKITRAPCGYPCHTVGPWTRYVLCVVVSLLLLLVCAGSCADGAASTIDPLSGGTSGGATAKAFVIHCDSTTAATAGSTELGSCERKLVVDITLDDGTAAGPVLETGVVVAAALDRARFPADAEPAAMTVAQTTASTLQVTLPPLRLFFRRSGVQMRYALDYLRDFPAALRDFVLPLRTATICDDGVTRCPAYTPLSGGEGGPVVVPAPMGVCCLCTSVECALSAEMCNASMRTHFCFRTAAAGSICVKEDGLRYGGWSIRAGTPYYAMDTTVSGPLVPTTATFHLSTDLMTVEQGTSRMQLLQTSDVNMAEARLRLNVSQRMLFNPLSGDRVSAGAAEWLLVPSRLVTVDGMACNKVGVTPEYFYSLSSAFQCNAQTGTCLANQLEDLRAADVAAVAQGAGGAYLASSLGAFTQETSGATRYLLDAVERTGGATLRWSANADAMTFTAVAVPGNLISVRFLTDKAEVVASVSNPGPYAGMYSIAIHSCTAARVVVCDLGGNGGISSSSSSDGVHGACVTPLLVRGGNTSAVHFRVSPYSLSGVGGVANCTVELRDAANVTLGSDSVSWAVATTTTTTTAPPTKSQQCEHCAFQDLRCLFGGVCEWQMLVWTVVGLSVTWCPYAILASWHFFAGKVYADEGRA